MQNGGCHDLEGGKNRELICNKYRVSVWGDEEIQETDDSESYINNVNVLNAIGLSTYKAKMVNFMLYAFYYKLKNKLKKKKEIVILIVLRSVIQFFCKEGEENTFMSSLYETIETSTHFQIFAKH